VHRDVKGDNVLVRLSDRFPVLTDFGSGHFQGAPRLTWQSLAPFTPEYLSPQACLFDIRLARHRDSYYAPTPADDLYALGVTAYRIVMGEYPPPMDAQQDEEGTWRVFGPDSRPRLESNPRVEPRLRAVILRLLSDAPEARGTATQVAEALEALADEGVARRLAEPQPAAEVPPAALAAAGGSERPRPEKRLQAWKAVLALAAVGACAVLLWSVRLVSGPPQRVSATTPGAVDIQAPDAGSAGVGDTSPTEPQAPASPTTEKSPVAQEPLPEPRTEQIRPDGKGHCPGRMQVAINGACWVEQLSTPADACAENGYVLLKGKCYAPAMATPRKPPPTSSPPEAR